MTQTSPNPPTDFETLDFTIEEERWNEYELSDGGRIRGRVILNRILRNPAKPDQFLFTTSSPIWAVFCPVHMRGKPSPNLTPEEKESAPKFDVHIDTNQEYWNLYRITRTGQKIKVKLEIDEVKRYADKFDREGFPLYHVPHNIVINVQNTQGPLN